MQSPVDLVTSLCVLALCASATDSDILTCQANFAMTRISCASLYEYSMCLGSATETASESSNAAAMSVLAAAYANYGQDCSDFVP